MVKRLNMHLAGRTIAAVFAEDDSILFKDTTAAEFRARLEGRNVLAAKQWGKYFWCVTPIRLRGAGADDGAAGW